jgi:hypothetical protein
MILRFRQPLALLVAAGLVAGCGIFPNVSTPLHWLNLAPELPASATNIRVKEQDTFTWTEFYVMFHASHQAIHEFLAASPGVETSKAEFFTPSYHLLPMSTLGGYSPDADYWQDDPYIHTNVPWFDPTLHGNGRRFKIENGNYYGELVVIDDTDTVYLFVYNG